MTGPGANVGVGAGVGESVGSGVGVCVGVAAGGGVEVGVGVSVGVRVGVGGTGVWGCSAGSPQEAMIAMATSSTANVLKVAPEADKAHHGQARFAQASIALPLGTVKQMGSVRVCIRLVRVELKARAPSTGQVLGVVDVVAGAEF